MAKSNFIVRGGADFSGIKKGLDQTQKQLSNFQNGVNRSMKIVGTALAGLATGKFIKDSTKMAMGVESAMDNIGRNMGSSSAAFNRWAQTQSKALGMARADAYKYGSTFSNLLSSFSSSSKETADDTQELMRAAAIISSKTGRSYEDTAERIRSGMLGSTEAIEDLGVYTNVSMIESTEAFKRFANGKSWSQLSFQVQQQIRLAAILEQTYARYGDTLADTTQTRQAMFIASLKNVQLNLGQAFLPIYNAVLPLLTALGNKLDAITAKLKYFTQALFGKAISIPVAQTQEQSAAISGIGDAAETAGEQTKKAAKDIKGSVAGFDEINTLTDKADANGGGGGGGAGIPAQEVFADAGGVDEELSPAMQKAVDKLLALIEPLKAISFDNLVNAFNNLKAAVAPITSTLFAGLEWAYLNIFVPLAKWTIENILPSFLNILAGVLGILGAVIESLKPAGTWLWENFLKPLATWTGGVVAAALDIIAKSLLKISDWMNTHKETVQGITESILRFFVAWKITELLAFIQLSGGVVGALNAIKTAIIANTVAKLKDKLLTMQLTLMYAKDFVVSLAKSTVELAKNTGAWLASNTAKAAGAVAQTSMNVATGIWNGLAAAATAVTTAFGAAIAFLTSPIGLVILAIAALVAGIALLIKHWDDVKLAAQTTWEIVTTVWGKASVWFDNNVLSPIKNSFKSAINFLIGLAEGFVNGFIKGINGIINALNMIQIDIPDWVPGIGGKSFGIDIKPVNSIKIPRLAKGGITNGPTLAMIGDNPGGREVVSPLDDLTDMIASAVGSAIMGAMQFAGSASSSDDIILNIDGREFARASLKSLNKESSRLGYRPILQTR